MIDGPKTAKELREQFGFKDATYFKKNSIDPLITEGLIAMSNPDKPTSSRQQYCLTDAGKQMLEEMQKKK